MEMAAGRFEGGRRVRGLGKMKNSILEILISRGPLEIQMKILRRLLDFWNYVGNEVEIGLLHVFEILLANDVWRFRSGRL